MKVKDIRDAYIEIRATNNSVPDDVLDFMKDAAIAALKGEEAETLTMKDGRRVGKSDYITAKTKDLQEYGYSTLTETEVRFQLNQVLKEERLNVIGSFIESDILVK